MRRDGEVAKTFWKPRSVKRLYDTREIPTTTVENVRDRFRAMYGIEEEFPVLQTEFGNIAVSTVQFDPFIFAAFAMRGAEIMLRTATAYSETEVIATANMHRFYSAMANIPFPPGQSYTKYGGRSVIVSPRGVVLAQEQSHSEEGIISAEIPIAKFRENRRIPDYALEVVKPVFDQYQSEIPLNHLDLPREQLPQTGQEMKALFDRISRHR